MLLPEIIPSLPLFLFWNSCTTCCYLRSFLLYHCFYFAQQLYNMPLPEIIPSLPCVYFSQQLYREVTIPLQLPAVCKQFVGVSFFEGIIELTLAVAAKCDPHNLALHYYQSGEPPEDLQGMQVYMQRSDCVHNNNIGFNWLLYYSI